MVAQSHQSPHASSRGRSCRDDNSRPLRVHSCSADVGSTTEKGAPRSATREDTTRSNIASPPHFGASSLSTACVDQLVHHSKAAAPEPSGGSSASAACPAAAQRCRSRRLTEPLRQLALRYRRPPPTLGHYRGRAERRARRCGAGSGFYSASGTISPLYSRSSRLLNNIYCLCITPGLALLLDLVVDRSWRLDLQGQLCI